jgi:Domain of unknown function (DUF4381)
MEQLPLRDIHLPEPVNFWPPAPGWIVLAVLLPLSIFLLIYSYKRIKRQTVGKSAAKLLINIKQSNQEDIRQSLVELSALLRRVAISTSGRADVAGLHGSAWLAYLDTPFSDQPFSHGIGQCLADAHYRPNLPSETDLDAVFTLCERWIKLQTNGKSKSKLKLSGLGGKK